MQGIRIKDKHSYYDFNAFLAKRTISLPKKKKILISVPYKQGAYDFSVALDEQIYEDRVVKYMFVITDNDRFELQSKVEKFTTFLYETHQECLHDDKDESYYFIASCDNVNFEEDGLKCFKITAEFTTYPFRISKEFVNEYDEDAPQKIEFNVIESKDIILNNIGYKVWPEVICSSNFKVNNIDFDSNVTSNDNFNLKHGENIIHIEGTGSIKFLFRKEVL